MLSPLPPPLSSSCDRQRCSSVSLLLIYPMPSLPSLRATFTRRRFYSILRLLDVVYLLSVRLHITLSHCPSCVLFPPFLVSRNFASPHRFTSGLRLHETASSKPLPCSSVYLHQFSIFQNTVPISALLFSTLLH